MLLSDSEDSARVQEESRIRSRLIFGAMGFSACKIWNKVVVDTSGAEETVTGIIWIYRVDIINLPLLMGASIVRASFELSFPFPVQVRCP